MLLAGCKEEAPDPLSQLPPATQTGAETFGCLVNGEAWVPKGRIGLTSNLTEYYNHGDFNVSAFRTMNSKRQSMGIFVADSLVRVGAYRLNDIEKQAVLFTNESCEYLRDSTVHRDGTLTITKLDIPNRIISGRFEFTLLNLGVTRFG